MSSDYTGKRLAELKVCDLKVELEKRNLETTGVKPALVSRLEKVFIHRILQYVVTSYNQCIRFATRLNCSGVFFFHFVQYTFSNIIVFVGCANQLNA